MLKYIQYIIITGLLTIWTNHNIRRYETGNGHKKASWLIEWFFFTFLAAFRLVDGTVGGADSENYVYAFLNRKKMSSEPLLYLLNNICLSFTDNYHVYFLIIYGIIVFGMLYFAAHVFQKANYSLLIMFFYFNMYVTSFGVMRQWIAISIGLISIVLLAKEKRIISILIALIAVGFHFTMLVYLGIIAMYVLCGDKIKRIPDKPMILVALIMNVSSYLLSDYFIRLLSQSEYKAYVAPDSLLAVSWIGYLPTIFFLLLVFLFVRYTYRVEEIDEVTRVFLFANLSLMYFTVALGMFRLFVLFMPLRAYALCKTRESLRNRIIVGHSGMNRMGFLFDIILLGDILIYTKRTIENGALPYVFSIMDRFA